LHNGGKHLPWEFHSILSSIFDLTPTTWPLSQAKRMSQTPALIIVYQRTQKTTHHLPVCAQRFLSIAANANPISRALPLRVG
jgi:hypothetical protein